MRKYILAVTLLLVSGMSLPACAQTGLPYVAVVLDNGLSAYMSADASNEYNRTGSLRGFKSTWNMYYMPSEDPGKIFSRIEIYEPEKRVNSNDFDVSFRSNIATGAAAQRETDIRMDFLAETFAWLDFLKENGWIHNAKAQDIWETADLSKLNSKQTLDAELLSITLYKAFGIITQGESGLTGTPLDMGRGNSNKESFCAMNFETCEQGAEKIRAKVNNEIKKILSNRSAADVINEHSAKPAASEPAARESKEDARDRMRQKAASMGSTSSDMKDRFNSSSSDFEERFRKGF